MLLFWPIWPFDIPLPVDVLVLALPFIELSVPSVEPLPVELLFVPIDMPAPPMELLLIVPLVDGVVFAPLPLVCAMARPLTPIEKARARLRILRDIFLLRVVWMELYVSGPNDHARWGR